ncbi:MAG: DEAD/DEAH box helicase [Chloroflexi bacterium]|nr:DEAD/DEAH box helicase [Chloroflexota bacterium]
MTPEQTARIHIDTLLEKSGWAVQGAGSVNLSAARGVAVREFGLKPSHGTADYLLHIDGKAAGVVEAKPAGYTLTGVETQSGKYTDGLPDILPAHRKPLPFLYETTGAETRFTNLLDPDPRSRNVFAFHTPDALAHWVGSEPAAAESSLARIAEAGSSYGVARNLRQRLRSMPSLDAGSLWQVQERAILNLEQSLAEGRPRALVQMATGSGKTFTACNLVYRLIKYAGARRVLFLVDRNNLGRQTLREFQGFTTPEENRKFTELYNVQLLQSGHIDPVSRVCISTIQRVYSMLRGEEIDEELEERSGFDFAQLNRYPATVEYNPAYPIDTFDLIITDECHRSIYNLWRQALEYFDAFLIGLTATPSAQTFGFFQQNLVMEYPHEQAVADGVNVDSDIYRIRTQITGKGSTVEAKQYVDRRDRRTRDLRWEQLDEDLTYVPNQLDRDVVAEDQIRTVIRTFRDKLFTEIFPGRTEVPKTIIFAKDDSHADDIVDIVRTEFGKGNDFCRKITYREHAPEQLIAAFRNSYHPRIVVTVDMIATGTDIKPVEIVFFMRNVQSRSFFEQMKGRGVRVISPTDFNAVTPDGYNKDRFVIVDAVGVTESELSESYSLEREPTLSFGRLLDLIAFGSREPDHLASLASRLARLSRKISPAERETIETTAGGVPLQSLITNLLRATDPDAAIQTARDTTGLDDSPPEAIADAERQLREDAAAPFAYNPELRDRLETVHQSYEQTIDTVSKDVVLEAGFTDGAAQDAVQSFREFIEENRDEITALQALYERPYRQRLRLDHIRALADAMQAPPRSWTTERLWQAYQRLDESRVRGSGQRQLADIVALVRYAIGDAEELAPFADHVNRRFEGWLAMQETAGRQFTPEQLRWLESIRDHIAGSVSIEPADFEYAPFNQQGGLMGAYTLFGDDLEPIINELNLELVR